METRVAVIGIIVEKPEAVERLNGILHEYREYIVGRMGVPYPKRGVSIISVAVDAPTDQIAALAGKVGNIDGVSAKTAYSNVRG
ncbi:MAG: iron-only hydrogenase system regulator [Atopobiaceae bacterium]|nr:iron-only hydrogenase system regulator [Atopobiaceae bacterium]MBR3313560.1 iron-only hydrogenase system regulator [Atopobiaceae bacterium]